MAVSAEEQKYLKSNQGSVVNHAEWKKEKKKYKIEDTIKGVDIGKELDKFHAACKKGVKASVDAGKVLQKKVALYKGTWTRVTRTGPSAPITCSRKRSRSTSTTPSSS